MSYRAEFVCLDCGATFTETLPRRPWGTRCIECCRRRSREATRKHADKRRAAGLPVSTEDPERKRARMAEYVRRPEVKAKRAAWIRERALDPGERRKILARQITTKALRHGDLKRGPCEVCGNERTDAHHDDYDKPLEVRWLCRLHHRQHHLQEGVV